MNDSSGQSFRKFKIVTIVLCLLIISVPSICLIRGLVVINSIEEVPEEITIIQIENQELNESVITPEELPEDPSEPPTSPVTEPKIFIDLSEDDQWLLSQVVYLESRGESTECQLAVASVVINRMETQGKSMYDIIYAKNQFAVTPNIGKYTASRPVKEIVKKIINEGTTVPRCVTFFRADYYHNWSDLVQPYCSIDNTYFSHDIRLCSQEGGCQSE